MCLTPPPLRSGSVPARDFTHGGHGGSAAAPPKPPSGSAFLAKLSVCTLLCFLGACASAQNAAQKDPMRCERDPSCARAKGTYPDCSKQCNDDPECVDMCRQLHVHPVLGHR